jgi:serine/threonine-protein kinase
MALASGTRLGSYEVVAQIGAGGMGEVYKARDTRLDRIVAIKVLPAHLADRAELRERFEREAKTIASLNHPLICTLYDTGHQDGIDFLVMEFLEGETLEQRLQKGSLPIQQVLQYAIEIADALDKAHRKGITHRDLKPGNIMLTKSGTKLLDFGLAKLAQEAAPAIPDSQLPTMKSAITGEGTILGTLQYMAPEQVEAKEVDARTDIFAFGAVIYEMATGRKAFEGKTSASLMAKILEVDPPSMASLQPMTPPALDRVVKKCLAKERDNRWQSASDLTDELRWIAGGSSAAPNTAAPLAKTDAKGWQRALILVLAVLAIAAVTSVVTWNLRPASSPAQPVSRLEIVLAPDDRLATFGGSAVALSPNGRNLVYVAFRDGKQMLFLRELNSLEANPIPGTEAGVIPFFSPDGQYLGFFAGGKLKKVPVTGGSPLTLCDAPVSYGASWSSQGTIIFSSLGVGPLMQVSDAGGVPQPVTHLGKGEIGHRWPEFLPGGKAVLFSPGGGLVSVQSLVTGERKNLNQGGVGWTQPHYLSSGHVVYGQAGNLVALPFNSQRLEVTGAAVPVIEGVMQSTATGSAQYSVSSTGTLVYIPSGVQVSQLNLVWVNRKGTAESLAAPPHGYVNPRFSPDGRRVAVGITESDSQIWIYDIARKTLTRWTFEGNNNLVPFWTPDGMRITFTSNKEGQRNLFWQLADGSGGLERLTTSEYQNLPGSWSGDGQVLVFAQLTPDSGYDIWVLRASDRKVQPFLRTQFNEGSPQFSPNGRWLAYFSDESGRREIYVQPYPGPGGKWQISTEGGTEPLWNRNGRELFYRNGNKMMAVEVTTQPSFSAGTPKVLFEGQYQLLPLVSTPNYDVAPDGQRFLMLKPTEQEQAATTQINVLLNWFEELKQKVPTGTK